MKNRLTNVPFTVWMAAVLWVPACGGSSNENSCDFTEPRCKGDTVLQCQDGSLKETPCESGTYCNFGDCAQTAVFFPQDAGPHETLVEWWYYTGHIQDQTLEWGFEATIFQYNLEALKGYMCHVAVTDKNNSKHFHTDGMTLTADTVSSSPIELDVLSCHFNLGGDGQDRVRASIPEGKEKHGEPGEWSFDLELIPQKRVALHGGDGLIDMSPDGGKSYYYSYTRLTAEGTLSTPEGAHSVSGQAWMDHQWGDFDMMKFKGWDWWSMQLKDNYELMLFQFRNLDNQLVSQAGTIVDPEGNLTEFTALTDFTITPLRSWPSPHTDGTYPLDWDIAVVPMSWQLQIRTSIDDQEMPNLVKNYWEGAVTIEGKRGEQPVSGIGYVELTGYASNVILP